MGFLFFSITQGAVYLPPVDVHSLRHTGATFIYDTTGKIRDVKMSTGHSNDKTAFDYVRDFDEDKIALVKSKEIFYKTQDNDEDAEINSLIETVKNNPDLLKKLNEIIAE